MDVFMRAIPSDYAVLSPRGPVPTDEGGYGWVSYRPGNMAPFPEFEKPAKDLFVHLDRWISQNDLPTGKVTLLGFSQGAAMALSFGLVFPDKVEQIACLSGFLPLPPLPDPANHPMQGMNIFISHGAQDKMIPIVRARETAAWLKQTGANVITCEANVGHRLSANCFHALQDFLK